MKNKQDEEKKLFNGKKVIVTGGAGFIGSHICEELVSLGSEVFCIDNLSAGKLNNIEFLIKKPNMHFIKMDVCDEEGMDKLFKDTSYVFHNAASKKNVCLNDPKRDLEVNAKGTLNLLQYAVKYKIKKFIHASTGSVYGEPTIFPTTEDHPLKPVSYYGVSKLAGERYVDVFCTLYGLNTTILRYFHVYGPRQESNEFGGVVSIFLRNIVENKAITIFGSGNQQRSFTWVKDIVKANINSVLYTQSEGQVYNIASGIKVTIKELAEKIIKMMKSGKKTQIVYEKPLIGDIFKFEVSNCKAVNELKISFEKDFWKTLNNALQSASGFLNR